MSAPLTAGLEDVVAADSAISSINGRRGELRYRGYSIHDLAEHATFEEVASLIWEGDLPDEARLTAVREELRSRRMARARMVDVLAGIPRSAHPLDVLRFMVSRDALENELVADNSAAANAEKAIDFTAWFPIVVAGFHREKLGRRPVEPRPDLDSAANFLWMLEGREPSADAVSTLDTSLVLHADHELNASTFAARVTTATQSNLHAAIASALGTLVGPRHGGASEGVVRMLEAIGTPARVEEYVHGELEGRRRIMGFGHRVYRVADPRARHLGSMARRLLAATPREPWIEILDRLALVMQRERDLYPNVDLYAAVVNHALGIDPAFYTSIFAMSRIVGWTAHAIEQLDGRMIRPVARYVGPPPRALPTAVATAS